MRGAFRERRARMYLHRNTTSLPVTPLFHKHCDTVSPIVERLTPFDAIFKKNKLKKVIFLYKEYFCWLDRILGLQTLCLLSPLCTEP